MRQEAEEREPGAGRRGRGADEPGFLSGAS